MKLTFGTTTKDQCPLGKCIRKAGHEGKCWPV